MTDAPDIAEVRKRVFGKHHKKPCHDPDVIECRRIQCQNKNKCMLRTRAEKTEAA